MTQAAVAGSRRGSALAVAFAAAGALAAMLVVTNERIADASVGRATPLLLLVALAFGGVAVRYSSAGVTVLVAFVYMNLSEALVRYHEFPSLLQLLVVTLAFAAWLKRDTERVRELARQPLALVLAGWLVLLFASTAWAADLEMADGRLIAIAKAFVIFALATLLMRNRTRFMQGIVALVASAVFIGAITIYQVATDSFSSEFGGLARIKRAQIYGDVFEPRVAGPIGDPNFFAQVLLLVLPLPAMLVFTSRSIRVRFVSLAAAGVIFATLVVTYSRGAIVALAVMALMMLRELHVQWRSTAMAAGALLLVLLLVPSDLTQRLLTIAQVLPSVDAPLHPDSSFQERRLLMSVAWVMFAANPLTGVGVGNYSARYDEYVGSTSSAARQYADPADLHFPHNLALEAAAENGLPGVLLLTAAFVVAWTALRDAEETFAPLDADLGAIAGALRIGLAGFLVSSLFLHLAAPRHLFLVFAFAATLQRLARRAKGGTAWR